MHFCNKRIKILGDNTRLGVRGEVLGVFCACVCRRGGVGESIFSKLLLLLCEN